MAQGGVNHFIIVNPNAGTGVIKKDWNIIAALLEKYGIRYTVRFTSGKFEAIRLAYEAFTEGFKTLITVGGDGTLNEVLNGVMNSVEYSPSSVYLGVIPVGTGNDWGRMFGIDSDYEKAVRTIAERKTMLHDVGIARFPNAMQFDKRYFINIAGAGFESIVVKKTNLQKDRGRSGKLIYMYNLLTSLISYKNTNADIIIDGNIHNFDLFSVNIGNGKYCGGGMRQTPDAIPDDGLLDVTVIGNLSKFNIIKSLPLLYNGLIKTHPDIRAFRCSKISISSPGRLFIEADGESIGQAPVEFSIIEKAVNIIYNEKII